MTNQYAQAAIIIFCIIIVYYIATYNNSTYEDYMHGFYCADDDAFCDRSDIDSMMIFIGKAEHGWLSTERTCYMLIMDDICNQSFTMKYRGGWGGIGVGTYTITADMEYDEDCIWGDKCRFEFDIIHGQLTIYDGDLVCAKLYKNAEITALAS